MSIVDEGYGFDHTILSKELVINNIYKLRGRGLRIVRKFADKLSFNKKGNRVYTEFDNR